jgi:hypothetical protein
MTKLTLVTAPAEMPKRLHLLNPWVQPHYADTIDTVAYDSTHTYNPREHAVLTHYVDQVEKSTWWQQAQELGLRIVVEHLGDSDVERTSHVNNGILTLRNPNWMWYSASWEWAWYGHDQYQPDRAYQHNFLMPMNLRRWHRDRIVKDLAPVLLEALYSYCAQGRELPGSPPPHIPWRGYINTAWYDSTPYSVVAESYMRSTKINEGLTYRTEVSEKIFKPMLGQQPFVVYGSVDTLRYLKREGFATYDNLWDETYDTTLDNQARFDQVTQVVRQAVDQHNYRTFRLDRATVERIQHNHARLFDRDTVAQRFRTEVVGDILAWWES